MKVVFSHLAVREMDDAAQRYDEELTGLGREFRTEIMRSARRIAAFPNAWSVERNDIRKCLLHRFPYKLLYAIEPEHILVIAVAHLHRKPGYWVDGERPDP